MKLASTAARSIALALGALALAPASPALAGPKTVTIAIPVIVKSLAPSPTHAASINCQLWAESGDLHQLGVGTLQTTLAVGGKTANVVIPLEAPEFALAYKAYYGPSHYSCFANLTPSNAAYEPTIIKGALAGGNDGLSTITNTSAMNIVAKPNSISGMHVGPIHPGTVPSINPAVLSHPAVLANPSPTP